MKQCTFMHCRVSYLSSFGFFNTPQTISLLDPSEYFDHYIPYIIVTPCKTLNVRMIKYFMNSVMLYSGRERSLVSGVSFVLSDAMVSRAFLLPREL